MTIVVVGWGNVGFETIKLLDKNNSVLVVDLNEHKYLFDFIQDKSNIRFLKGNALDWKELFP
jgi:Trk K+ transport system NAD-binding subunit